MQENLLPKRGPGRPRKAQEALSPRRGPGRPRKEPQEALSPRRGPGRPRKETEALSPKETTDPKRGPGPRNPKRTQMQEPFDPVVELTRLIRQRNEEQARQRKAAYANMLGL